MRRLWAALRTLCGLLLIAAGVVFATANRNDVALNLYPLPLVVVTPVFAVVIGALFGGALLALIATLPVAIARRHALRKIRLQLRATENELAALKAERQLPSA